METEGKFYFSGAIAERTAMFTVEVPPVSLRAFKPGQYVYLEWRDPPVTDAAGNGRYLSIASPPHELPILSFATRLTGSAFKKCIEMLPDGSPVGISGPFGSFTLPECLEKNVSGSPIVFVAGGIGITPIRSILLESLSRYPLVPFFLFSTNRTVESSMFLRELGDLSENKKNFIWDQTVTHPTGPLPDGVNSVPLSPRRLFERVGGKAMDGEYYISGTPQMVESVKTDILGLGIPPERVHTDPFLGYP